MLDDDVSPMHSHESSSEVGAVNYTLTYPSNYYYHPTGIIVVMTVRVFVPWMIITRKEIAYNIISYRITKALNGHIIVQQSNRTIVLAESGAIVSTKNVTDVEVDLYDPHSK